MNEFTILVCARCGRVLGNNPSENVSFGESPYPHDEGFGCCRDCGGDLTVSVDDRSLEAIKKRLGRNAVSFYEARFEVLRKALSPANREKFEAMDYVRKIDLVIRLIERGAMI